MQPIEIDESLTTWSQVYFAIAIIGAIIFAIAAFGQFASASNQFSQVARTAHYVAAWTYIGAAVATVIGGYFMRAIVAWMLAVAWSLNSVNRNLEALARNANATTAGSTTKATPTRRQANKENRKTPLTWTANRAVAPVESNEPLDGPHAVVAGWDGYGCSECKRSLPDYTFIPRSCPHCGVMFINSTD